MSSYDKSVKFALAAIAAGAALWAGCNTNPVDFKSQSGVLNYEDTVNVSGSEQIDLLWVIDNSGSMCQEQEVLGQNFDAFINQLQGTNLDFHIAVTTTDMNPMSPREPVARPGLLQSTPQPVVGFDPTCHQAVNADGELIAGDYSPVRDAIAAAIACSDNADPMDYVWSDQEIACAVAETPGCMLNGQLCDGASCLAADLFPDPSLYRDIPLVLQSEEYRDENGVLDVDRLRDDFRCMSLVGTRGYGIEEGLEAAVEAVSLDKTGGPADLAEGSQTMVDPSAPNHGFLRQDAKFGLIFVTDENDCSVDGELQLNTCTNDLCDFYNSTQVDPADSPLLQPETLKEGLLENLRASKANPELAESEVLIASIHGRSDRYTGEIKTAEQCEAPGYEGVPYACSSELGNARSGDRYERFLRLFPNFYPQPDQSDVMKGWMCEETFAPALEAIGEFITPLPSGCVQRNVFPCDGDDLACPDFPNGDPGVCSPFINRDGAFFCESGIQVRAQLNNPTAEERERLSTSGWCVEGSFDLPEYPNGCIIDRSRYGWSECATDIPGIRLQWNDETAALRALSGTEIGIRYAAVVN